MATATLEAPREMTAEQFYAACLLKRAELVDGHVVALPFRGMMQSLVVGNIACELRQYIRSRSLGHVCAGGGFRLSRDPDTVLCPNVSFVRAERLEGADRSTFIEGAPDLAVEVVMPEIGVLETEEGTQVSRCGLAVGVGCPS